MEEIMDGFYELSSQQRQRIRNRRKEIGIRGDDLSTKIGRGKSYVSQIESGKISKVPLDALGLIAEGINFSIAEIIKDDEEFFQTMAEQGHPLRREDTHSAKRIKVMKEKREWERKEKNVKLLNSDLSILSEGLTRLIEDMEKAKVLIGETDEYLNNQLQFKINKYQRLHRKIEKVICR